MKSVLIAAAASVLFACSMQSAQQGDQNGASDVKEIDLQLPKKDSLPAALAAKLTNYRFTVTPNNVGGTASLAQTNSTCAATAADKVSSSGKYDDKVVLSAKLKRGCTYTVALDIGNLDSTPKAVYIVWYSGSAQVDTSNVQGDKINLTIPLALNPDRQNDIANLPPVVTVQSTDVDLVVSAKLPDATVAPTATIQSTSTSTGTSTSVTPVTLPPVGTGTAQAS